MADKKNITKKASQTENKNSKEKNKKA